MFDTNEKKVLCAKGKLYKTFEPSDFEAKSGICLWVDGELDEKIPLTLKMFDKYFTTIGEMRDNKINEILK
jgi:hypothetical protein